MPTSGTPIGAGNVYFIPPHQAGVLAITSSTKAQDTGLCIEEPSDSFSTSAHNTERRRKVRSGSDRVLLSAESSSRLGTPRVGTLQFVCVLAVHSEHAAVGVPMSCGYRRGNPSEYTVAWISARITGAVLAESPLGRLEGRSRQSFFFTLAVGAPEYVTAVEECFAYRWSGS